MWAKCCVCCFCCVLGYHDVVFQKVQNLSFQKSIWSMGLFPAVKKLYHFEIPMGYCYSPLDGSIICPYPDSIPKSLLDGQNHFLNFLNVFLDYFACSTSKTFFAFLVHFFGQNRRKEIGSFYWYFYLQTTSQPVLSIT